MLVYIDNSQLLMLSGIGLIMLLGCILWIIGLLTKKQSLKGIGISIFLSSTIVIAAIVMIALVLK